VNRRFGKITFCIAGALIMGVAVRADELAMNTSSPLPDNPYSQVVVRNIVGRNPPTPVDPNAESLSSVKISPNGIQDFFGTVKVLFKVSGAPAKPGQPPKDQFYMLSQGQRQDDIEVVNIDQKNGLVTFNNHGVTQTLALVSAPASPGGALPVGAQGAAGGPTGMNPQGGNDNGNGRQGFTRFGQRGGGPGRGGNNNNNPNGNSGAANGASTGTDSMLRTVPTRIYQPEASNLTPEENIIRLEQNRAKALDSGDRTAPLFPPTPLTGQY